MIKILVVDDAALMRKYLKNIIEDSFEKVEVLLAQNGIIGIEKTKLFNPDIILLDYKMPKMDGLECLQEIVKITKAPVVMVSAYTPSGATVTIEALNMGAFDFLCKPEPQANDSELDFESNLLTKIEGALRYSKKTIERKNQIYINNESKSINKDQINKVENDNVIADINDYSNIRAVGIGISTGGPPIITKILKSLPKTFNKSILIVQHMPPGFTFEFAKRLNEVSEIDVMEAQDNEILKPGYAYIAPGGMQMKVESQGSDFIIRVYDGEKVSGHKPSADVLFSSMAESIGNKSIGIIMTGMGSDGSKGLLKLKKSGAITWGQNKETCVVYGMPKVAYENGAVNEQLSVDQIINKLKNI